MSFLRCRKWKIPKVMRSRVGKLSSDIFIAFCYFLERIYANHRSQTQPIFSQTFVLTKFKLPFLSLVCYDKKLAAWVLAVQKSDIFCSSIILFLKTCPDENRINGRINGWESNKKIVVPFVTLQNEDTRTIVTAP